MSIPIQIKPFVLPTTKMAKYLGVDRGFLQRNKGILFKQGVHFNRPIGTKRDMWVVAKMEEWALNQSVSKEALEVLDNICSI